MPATENVGSFSAFVSASFSSDNNREWQMQARRRFTLVGRVLRRKSVEMRHAEPLELAEMIAK